MAEKRLEIDAELSAIAITYRNNKCIADEAFHKVKVNTEAFKYYKFNKDNYFYVPETHIGEKGKANQIELRGKLETDRVESHALSEVIPVSTQKESLNSAGGFDLRALATKQITDCLLLRKEIEFANFLSDKSNYGDNVKTLQENEKINKETSNAVKLVQNSIDAMLYPANIMILSRKVASKLRMNPYIVDACGSASKKAGIAPLDAIKELFGFKKILIGEAVHNTAKKGQKINLETCFGNNIYLSYVDETATTDYGISFGYQCINNEITVGTYHDPEIGTEGADVIKGFYSNKFLNTCPECGYMIEGVI